MFPLFFRFSSKTTVRQRREKSSCGGADKAEPQIPRGHKSSALDKQSGSQPRCPSRRLCPPSPLPRHSAVSSGHLRAGLTATGRSAADWLTRFYCRRRRGGWGRRQGDGKRETLGKQRTWLKATNLGAFRLSSLAGRLEQRGKLGSKLAELLHLVCGS